MKKLLLILSLLILTSSKILSTPGPQWIVYNTSNSAIPSNALGPIEIDSNNVKWIGSEVGLIRFDDVAWTLYNSANSPVTDRVMSIVRKEKDNSIWFGVNALGLYHLKNGVFTVYNSSNSGLPRNDIYTIAIESDSIKWIGSGTRLVRFDNVTWKVFDTLNSGYQAGNALSLEVSGHTKWFGTPFRGLGRYNDTTWTYYTGLNSGLHDDVVFSIFIENNDVIWLGTRFKGVYKFNTTLNQWTNYNTSNSQLYSDQVMGIFRDPLNGKLFFGLAVYSLSTLSDTTWDYYGPPMPVGTYVENFRRDKYDNVWIPTDNGLFVYNENGVVGINDHSSIVQDFELFQNYPNPFNPSTKINYELRNTNFVSIKVYNLQGKEVTTLVNQVQNAGSYSVDFESKGLASGIYFYILASGNFFEIKKMVLVK